MATHAYSTPAPEDGAHHRVRRAIEEKIEALIVFLDYLDPDPDLESGADAEHVNEDGDGEFAGGNVVAFPSREVRR